MKARTKERLLLNTVATVISVVPPVAATLTYFPVWISEGQETAFSGLCVLLLVISTVPLYRLAVQWLKTPSSPLIWLFVLIVFSAAAKIADQVTAIALIGFISNTVGAIIFYVAKRRGGEDEA